MLTLSYGYKKPQSNDKGPVVFPALEDNIDQLNSHNHNGTNSAPLAPSAILAVSQTILAANWVLVANGLYKQTVTASAGIDLDNTQIQFRLSDDSIFYPTVKPLSATQYEIFINDASEQVTAIYK